MKNLTVKAFGIKKPDELVVTKTATTTTNSPGQVISGLGPDVACRPRQS